MFQRNPFRLSLFMLSACFAIWLGYFCVEATQAIQLIKLGGYWLMLLSVALLVLSFFHLLAQGQLHRLKCARMCWPPMLWIGFATLVLISLQPSGYKIVMDEPVLAATSLQMHLEREVLTVSRAYEIGGVFTSLGGYVDKRPYFYPFLLSLLHDFTGYRALQGLVLNALLTPVLLTLIYLIGRFFQPKFGGVFGGTIITGCTLICDQRQRCRI